MKLDGLPPFYFHYSLLRSDCTWHSHHLGRYNEVRYLGLLSCVLVLRYRRCIQFEVVCGSTSSSLGSTLVCISFISSAMGSEWNCNYTFSFFITIGRTCSNYAFSRQEDVYAFRERGRSSVIGSWGWRRTGRDGGISSLRPPCAIVCMVVDESLLL